MEGKRIDVRSVRALIERALAEDPESGVVIVADKDSNTGIVVKAMDQCRLAGAMNVSLAAKRETGRMILRKGMSLGFAAAVAVVLNIVLFASAALLSRDRPVRQTSTAPTSVNLVTLKAGHTAAPAGKEGDPQTQAEARDGFHARAVSAQPAGAGAAGRFGADRPVAFCRGPRARAISFSTAAIWTSRRSRFSSPSRYTR